MTEFPPTLGEFLAIIGSFEDCHLADLRAHRPILSLAELQTVSSESKYGGKIFAETQYPSRVMFNGEEGWMVKVGEFFPEQSYEDETGYIHTPEEVSYWWSRDKREGYQVLEPGTEVRYGELDAQATVNEGTDVYSYSEQTFQTS